jgi:hypothetical protein
VHNHLLRANPAAFYMHVGGYGDPVKMATAIRAALAEKQDAAGRSGDSFTAPAIYLDTAQLDQIIGAKGQPMGVSISSACRGATLPRWTVRYLHLPAAWRCDRKSDSSRMRTAGRDHGRLRDGGE